MRASRRRRWRRGDGGGRAGAIATGVRAETRADRSGRHVGVGGHRGLAPPDDGAGQRGLRRVAGQRRGQEGARCLGPGQGRRRVQGLWCAGHHADSRAREVLVARRGDTLQIQTDAGSQTRLLHFTGSAPRATGRRLARVVVGELGVRNRLQPARDACGRRQPGSARSRGGRHAQGGDEPVSRQAICARTARRTATRPRSPSTSSFSPIRRGHRGSSSPPCCTTRRTC